MSIVWSLMGWVCTMIVINIWISPNDESVYIIKIRIGLKKKQQPQSQNNTPKRKGIIISNFRSSEKSPNLHIINGEGTHVQVSPEQSGRSNKSRRISTSKPDWLKREAGAVGGA